MFAAMTLQEAEQIVRNRLAAIYDRREANNIADWVMEHITGWQKVDRVIHRQSVLDLEKLQLLEKYADELVAHKPVQYVLQEAWFAGLKFYVDESVLIPRPETEELVEWIIPEAKEKSILDVGTGSGCIPVALKKKLPGSAVYACDVSENALEVARKNATYHNTAIGFFQLDFLDRQAWKSLPRVHILASNPPYVPLKDKDSMHKNVVQYEPHLALFVQDNDPLIFYHALAAFAYEKLLPGGCVFAEIHEDLASSVQELFIAQGFTQTLIKKDMQGKGRMVRAAKT